MVGRHIFGNDYSNIEKATISPDGKVVFVSDSQIYRFNPLTQKSEMIYDSTSEKEITSPFLINDNKLVFKQDDKITIVDKTTNNVAVSSDNIPQQYQRVLRDRGSYYRDKVRWLNSEILRGSG